MPMAPKRFCAYCRGLHDGRCPVNRREQQRAYDERRPVPSKRGYDEVWRRCRDAFLRANPFCSDCQAKGRMRSAEEVHHTIKIRDDASRRLDWETLLGLCKSCHSARTAKGE